LTFYTVCGIIGFMDIEKEIRNIKKRNARVEKDKAWEKHQK